MTSHHPETRRARGIPGLLPAAPGGLGSDLPFPEDCLFITVGHFLLWLLQYDFFPWVTSYFTVFLFFVTSVAFFLIPPSEDICVILPLTSPSLVD